MESVANWSDVAHYVLPAGCQSVRQAMRDRLSVSQIGYYESDYETDFERRIMREIDRLSVSQSDRLLESDYES